MMVLELHIERRLDEHDELDDACGIDVAGFEEVLIPEDRFVAAGDAEFTPYVRLE
jgi:hypothetical protein